MTSKVTASFHRVGRGWNRDVLLIGGPPSADK